MPLGFPTLGPGVFASGFVVFIYLAFCLMTIANKFGVRDSWWAFIPIVNIWYMCVLAEKPGWWVILFFIPVVNIIMAIIVWMAIAKRAGKPDWYGILMIVPVVNLIIPAIIAFT
jgi:hypothetical protein